ncbi:MAG: hypothetical protein IBX55_00335 [Methyloprofundus sp.]|nr:hypothetical protein [Methyloprofundus sp.]
MQRTDGVARALIWTAFYGNPGVFNAFLTKECVDVNVQNRFGANALMIAVAHDRIDAAKLLLEVEELNINLQDEAARTVLDITREEASNDIV